MTEGRLCDTCRHEFYPEVNMTLRFGVWKDESNKTYEDCILSAEFPDEEEGLELGEVEDEDY